MKYTIFFLLLAIPLISIGQELKIPESMICSTVFVSTNNETGSGVIISDSNKVFFVTARHVVFSNDSLVNLINILYYPNSINSNSAIMTIDLRSRHSDTIVGFSKEHDLCVILIGHKKKKDNNEVLEVCKQITVPTNLTGIGITGDDIKFGRKYTQANIGAEVYLFGYPQSIGLQKSPQFDYFRPLLRKGIIAGKYEKNKTIILDCPSYFGNSGGPVYELSNQIFETDAYMIGIMSQYVPFVDEMDSKQSGAKSIQVMNSGYSIIIPIDFVIELTKKFH